MGKGPVLASKVTNIIDLNSYFLPDLSFDTCFKSFTGLNKNGNYGIHPHWKARGTSQEDAIISYNGDNNRGRESRVIRELANLTNLCSFTFQFLGRLATLSAISIVFIPGKDLSGKTYRMDSGR